MTSWSRTRGECRRDRVAAHRQIDADVLAAGASGRLRVVANVAVGYDNIDVRAAAAHGVVVCNTPGVLDETTADLAFSLILAASRLASEAEADLRSATVAGLGGHAVPRPRRARRRRSASSATAASAARWRAAPTGFGMRVLHHAAPRHRRAGLRRRSRRAARRRPTSSRCTCPAANRHASSDRRPPARAHEADRGAREHGAWHRWSTRPRWRTRSTTAGCSRPVSTCSNASPQCTRACSTRAAHRAPAAHRIGIAGDPHADGDTRGLGGRDRARTAGCRRTSCRRMIYLCTLSSRWGRHG